MVGDITKVYCLSNNYHHKDIIDFEDAGVVAIQFKNGVIGSIHFTINSYHQNMEGSLTFFGEKGTVKIGGEYLNKLEYQDIEGLEIKNICEGNPPNDFGRYKGSMSNHDLVYKEIADMLMSNNLYSVKTLDCLKTVEIINKIYLSALENNNNMESKALDLNYYYNVL